MLKIISCNNLNYREKLKKYLENDILKADKVTSSVKKIIAEVKKGGDRSLLSLTNKYENNNFKNIKDLEVSKSEINNSLKQCTKDFIKSTKVAINRVKNYQKKLLPNNLIYKDKTGTKLGCLWKPISSCGLYIPGGKAIYPSSVFMNAVAVKISRC